VPAMGNAGNSQPECRKPQECQSECLGDALTDEECPEVIDIEQSPVLAIVSATPGPDSKGSFVVAHGRKNALPAMPRMLPVMSREGTGNSFYYGGTRFSTEALALGAQAPRHVVSRLPSGGKEDLQVASGSSFYCASREATGTSSFYCAGREDSQLPNGSHLPRPVATQGHSRPDNCPWSPQCSPRASLRSNENSLEFDELRLEYTFFDPCRQPLQGQLFQKLHLPPSAHVEPIRGPAGSCNAGMWMLRDGALKYMLKLVRVLPSFMGPSQPSESQKYAKLAQEHPEMVRDPSLSFPCKIFHCLGKGGSKTHDLVVMRWVGGLRFSEFIMRKLHAKDELDLMIALEHFGSFLADFHGRYNGMQHGDLTPANIFYDEQRDWFTLVDVADIAPRNPVIQCDTERFISGLKLLSVFYGEDLWAQGRVRFEAGYNARNPGLKRP